MNTIDRCIYYHIFVFNNYAVQRLGTYRLIAAVCYKFMIQFLLTILALFCTLSTITPMHVFFDNIFCI